MAVAVAEGHLATSEPQRLRCQDCDAEVLLVLAGSASLLVEVSEVLPRQRCPRCSSIERHGHRNGHPCRRCGGSGYVGERLPRFGVAICHDGRARLFDAERTSRRHGEAVHRLHQC